jgi:hypothetical protein
MISLMMALPSKHLGLARVGGKVRGFNHFIWIFRFLREGQESFGPNVGQRQLLSSVLLILNDLRRRCTLYGLISDVITLLKIPLFLAATWGRAFQIVFCTGRRVGVRLRG